MKIIFRLFLIMMLTAVVFQTTPLSGQMLMLPENPLIKKEAPDFVLKLTNGSKTSFGEYRQGQSAIVFFWATWCPHCRTQLSELNESKADFESRGIKIILVDLQESAEKVNGYLQKSDIQYDVFLDEDGKVSEDYVIIGVPTFFLVSKDGTIEAIEHTLPENYEEILTSKN